jgi:hypothetical protein
MPQYSNRGWIRDVALGQIVAFKGRLLRGFNDSLTTTWASIWAGTSAEIDLSLLDTPATVKVTSTSVKDTAAGTGAQTVLLTGLNASGVRVSETISMNGLTAVVSANTYSAVEILRIETVGSDTVNQGTLWVGNGVVANDGTPADKFLLATPRCNASNTLAYTVPASHKGTIINAVFTSTDASKGFLIRVGIRGTDGIERYPIMLGMETGLATFDSNFADVLTAGETLLIHARLTAAPNGGIITALVDILEEEL